MNKKRIGWTLDHSHQEDKNLMEIGPEPPPSALLSANLFELFDPLKQPNRPHSWPSKLNEAGTTTNSPPFVTPSNETPSPTAAPVALPTTPVSSLSYPYPIKLRLKLTIFPEIKPFSLLVQRIRNEYQTQQVICILDCFFL